MGLRHLAYVGMLAFCLAGTLPLVPLYHLRVFSRPGRLGATVVVSGAPFLAWDVWAAGAGHWHFDPSQTLPWRMWGLPVEEIAFFVVIPLVSILAYEAVRAVRGDRTPGQLPRSDQAAS
jgi:lycopene cyclase domain-containing protein